MGANPKPMKPYRLDSSAGAACVHDVGHQWVIQHQVWNGNPNVANSGQPRQMG